MWTLTRKLLDVGSTRRGKMYSRTSVVFSSSVRGGALNQDVPLPMVLYLQLRRLRAEYKGKLRRMLSVSSKANLGGKSISNAAEVAKDKIRSSQMVG